MKAGTKYRVQTKAGETYSDFAYNVKYTMGERLKSAPVYDDKEKLLECSCLKQFYQDIPKDVQFLVQDKPDADTAEKAEDLAQDCVTRREE